MAKKKKKRRKAAKGKPDVKAVAPQTQEAPLAEEASPEEEKTSPKGEAKARKRPAGEKKRKKPSAMPSRRGLPNWPLTALAGAGMLLTAYLVVTSWLGGYPLYCAEGSSCEVVQSSRWGTFLYLPTAFWGFLAYASLAFIGLRVSNAAWHWKSVWAISLVGLGYSLYLNAISFFVIGALCAYCIASLSIMAAIFAVVLYQRPRGLPDLKYPAWVGATAVATLLIVGGLHLHYSGVFDPAAGPENPYLKGLAQHLSSEGAVLYGAYW